MGMKRFVIQNHNTGFVAGEYEAESEAHAWANYMEDAGFPNFQKNADGEPLVKFSDYTIVEVLT